MTRLPVIVGFGGYNAAGRSSFHHGFRRTVIESLDSKTRQETLAGLGVMTQLLTVDDEGFVGQNGERLTLEQIEENYAKPIMDATLVRRIDKTTFDVDKLDLSVKSAGQLPSGFDLAELYPSRFHPRGLQMSLIGGSDALHSMGIPWETVIAAVRPDEVSVHSGSAMGQLDSNGLGGTLQARLRGKRASAKQLPFGLSTMPADFINAYVLGSVGTTGSVSGACATFLYNLKAAVEEIQSGKCRVAFVGNSEAPITPEIIEGYSAMSALGTWQGLKKIEGNETPNCRRASRPFGKNCGFTLAESVQYVILMDDKLAVELGAQIHGSVPDVFISADGFKKSISAPGPGNYITLTKAVASACQLVGKETVQQNSFVHAHGSSTPVNRVTESELLDRVAETFNIKSWPVTAVKAFVGHSLGPASGDQLVSALGSFHYGIIPGIKTVDAIADDVHQQNLAFSTSDVQRDTGSLAVAFLNSKGFGGNNASAVLLSPSQTKTMLTRRYGESVMASYKRRSEQAKEIALQYDEQALKGNFDVIYKFGESLIDDSALELSEVSITVPGFEQPIEFHPTDRYADLKN